ncbi:Myotubularin- protein 9, partial [Desmophyllum pertusum]
MEFVEYIQIARVLIRFLSGLLHSAVEHVEKKARGQQGTLTICCKNFDLVKLKFSNIEEALNVASSIEVLSTIVVGPSYPVQLFVVPIKIGLNDLLKASARFRTVWK